jgi:hypothetical protein
MIGAFVGATVVSLMQYLRTRDRRALLLCAMFLLQAFSLSREWWDPWKDVSLGAVCLTGLALLFLLPSSPAAPPSPPPAREADAPHGSPPPPA